MLPCSTLVSQLRIRSVHIEIVPHDFCSSLIQALNLGALGTRPSILVIRTHSTQVSLHRCRYVIDADIIVCTTSLALVLTHADDLSISADLPLHISGCPGVAGVESILAARAWHVVELHKPVFIGTRQEFEERLSVLIL